MWITEIIPLPATALLGAVLCVVLGVADEKTVLASFANPIVFVYLGGFIIARAMHLHGLDRRLALNFLANPMIGRSPLSILAGLGMVTALLSMWVSNTATTAMMLPIALGVLATLRRLGHLPEATPAVPADVGQGSAAVGSPAPRSHFDIGVMLFIAYAASLGGIGTPVGSPTNLVATGLLRQMDREIPFLTWMALTVPILAVMMVILFLLLAWLYPVPAKAPVSTAAWVPASNGVEQTPETLLAGLRQECRRLGPWTAGERNTLIVFLIAISLWIAPGLMDLPGIGEPKVALWLKTHLPEATVALLAAVLLFLLPTDIAAGRFTLTWEEAVKVDWGTILLFGGGLALGAAMFETGVAQAMGKSLSQALGINTQWMLTAFAIGLAISMTELASNTASANMIVPVVVGISEAAQVSPIPPALGACLAASFSFMLPVSTPPNAIVYGSGLVPLPHMLRAGLVLNLVGAVVLWVGLRLLCPALGLM